MSVNKKSNPLNSDALTRQGQREFLQLLPRPNRFIWEFFRRTLKENKTEIKFLKNEFGMRTSISEEDLDSILIGRIPTTSELERIEYAYSELSISRLLGYNKEVFEYTEREFFRKNGIDYPNEELRVNFKKLYNHCALLKLKSKDKEVKR